MKIIFQYQRYFLRVGICGLFVLLWIIVSRLLAELISYLWLYLILSAAITVAVMVVFYRKTEFSGAFIKSGSFEKTESEYLLNIGRGYRFTEVKRLCAWRSNLYGTVFWTLQIEAEKTMKIMSVPCKSEEAFVETDLFAIYSELMKDFPNLKQERNADGSGIPYFYSR